MPEQDGTNNGRMLCQGTTSVNIIVDNITAEVESLVLNNPELRGTFGAMFGGGGSLGGISSIFGGVFANGGTVKPGKAHVVGDGGEPECLFPIVLVALYHLANWRHRVLATTIL